MNIEKQNLNEPQNKQLNILAVSGCPDLTNVWGKILETHKDNISERDKYCDALWLLEKGGFCQLKFGL